MSVKASPAVARPALLVSLRSGCRGSLDHARRSARVRHLMGLTGRGLLWALGILTLALPVLTVVVWSRLSRRHVLTVSGRVALIVASQVVTVAMVAVAVNDYAYLYGSWDEVWRSATQPFGANHYRVSQLAAGKAAGRVILGGVSQVRPVGPYRRSSRW